MIMKDSKYKLRSIGLILKISPHSDEPHKSFVPCINKAIFSHI